jgi:Protein of unknown function (DUF2806)
MANSPEIVKVMVQASSNPETAKFYTKLLETIGNGLGMLFEPLRIRLQAWAESGASISKAKAEREVKVIESQTDGKIELVRIKDRDLIADAKERAKERVRSRDEKRQEHLEAVAAHAALEAPETVSDDPVDEDWFAFFVNGCEDVSNEQMQSVWGRILAGEVSKPGSFSLRTLAAVRTMSQLDAEVFTRFCSVVWEHEEITTRCTLIPLILNPHLLPAMKLGLHEMAKLDAMGLILYESNAGYQISRGVIPLGIPTTPFLGEMKWHYHGRTFVFTKSVPPPTPGLPGMRPSSMLNFETGHIILTDVGAELYPIAGSTEHTAYLHSTLHEINLRGWTVQERGAQA